MSFKSRAIQAAIERERARKEAADAAYQAETAKLSFHGLEMCDRFAAQFSVPFEELAVEVVEYLTGTRAAAIKIQDDGVIAPLMVVEVAPGEWQVILPAGTGRNQYYLDRDLDTLKTLADFGGLYYPNELPV